MPKPIPDQNTQVTDYLKQILHAINAVNTKQDDILEKIDELEMEVLQMAANQADLDTALQAVTQGIADLQVAVGKIQPTTPIDFTTEVTALNAAASSLQAAITQINTLVGA